MSFEIPFVVFGFWLGGIWLSYSFGRRNLPLFVLLLGGIAAYVYAFSHFKPSYRLVALAVTAFLTAIIWAVNQIDSR